MASYVNCWSMQFWANPAFLNPGMRWTLDGYRPEVSNLYLGNHICLTFFICHSECPNFLNKITNNLNWKFLYKNPYFLKKFWQLSLWIVASHFRCMLQCPTWPASLIYIICLAAIGILVYNLWWRPDWNNIIY